jgi:uncharacterized membrane protein
VPLWIPITVAAALCQNIRTTMQQKIRGILSVDGANFVRYLYGAPLALGMLAFLVFVTGRQVPSISPHFLLLVTIAGVAQIVATSLMIHAFSLRNFAVGTVYSKTETVFVALFATFIAGEPLKLRCLGRHSGLPGRRRHPERAGKVLRRARRAGRPHAQGGDVRHPLGRDLRHRRRHDPRGVEAAPRGRLHGARHHRARLHEHHPGHPDGDLPRPA